MRDDISSCVGIFRTDAVLHRVRANQASMAELAEAWFSESELEHLRTVVRLVIELYEYFQLPCAHSFCLSYVGESVFSGIDSYCIVTRAYRMPRGAKESQIEWNSLSLPELKTRYACMFKAFEEVNAFETKCRLLLDLYKVLIVFAGLTYD